MKNHMTIDSPVYNQTGIKAAPGYPCHREILDVIYAMMCSYLERHSKMFVMTLTFTFPEEDDIYISPDNQTWQRFLNAFMMAERRYHSQLDPRYVWVREWKEDADDPLKEKHQHYHLILFFNGQCIQQITGACRVAARLWPQAVGGSCAPGNVHFHTDEDLLNGVKVLRGDNDTFADVFHRLTYYAKTSTKGHPSKPVNVREFGHSAMP